MLFLRSFIPAVTVALIASTFGQAVSAEQQVGDSGDTLLAETNPPTLPIIEVKLPAGVSPNDEDIADVIDSLIRGDGNGSSKNPKPNPPPLPNQQASRKEAMFRQQFTVQNNREFADEELELLEDLLEQYTLYFAPLSPIEVETKVTTDCTIHRQYLLNQGDRKLDSSSTNMLRHGNKRRELEESLTTLQVDFTMTYESMHYNVTEYPKLFQNWMANNGNVVLEQMQFLSMDVVSVDRPRRIVVMTPEPTSPATSLPITKEATNGEGIVLPPLGVAMPPTPTPKVKRTIAVQWSLTAIVLFSVALVIAIAILTVAICIFLNHRRSSNNNEVTNGDPEAAREHAHSEAAWKSTAALQGSSQYEENTLSTMDLELVESSSSVFP